MTPNHLLTAALALAATLPLMVVSKPSQYKELHVATDSLVPPDNPPTEGDREKRAYSPHLIYSRWKPSVYQLNRPYVIPVYGPAGKVPIFFPPQKINLNPGYPVDNPPPFKGPTYLPPTIETTTMKLINRFNGDDDNDDDRPIWSGSQPTSSGKESSVVPTRPPRPPGMTEFPPLVHEVSGGGSNTLSSGQEVQESVIRATTARSIVPGPSNCVWAIVSCCSVSTTSVPDSCFEQRGCPGPFWGSSPCESEFAKAAIDTALNYYSQ